MKIFCLVVLLFLVHAQAQRRAQGRHETNVEQPVRSRGRSRFSAPEYVQPSEDTNRRTSRRRIETNEKTNYVPVTASTTVSYAVEENVDEIDPAFKPRVLTETKFEAQNIPPPAEQDLEDLPEDDVLPTVKIETPSSDSDVEPVKVTEKPVPITRNNVRKNEGRNGGSRSKNDQNTRTSNSNRRNGSRRVYEEYVPEVPEIPSRVEQTTEKFEEKDENEIRKEIVRNSMPHLPQRGIIAAIPLDTKKPIRKTIKTRLNTNQKTEDTAPRSRTNTRVVENYIPTTTQNLDEYTTRRIVPEPIQRTRATPRIEEPRTPRQRTRGTRKPQQTSTIASRSRGTRRRTEVPSSTIAPRRLHATEEVPRTRSGRKLERVPEPQTIRSRTNRVEEEKPRPSGRRQTSRFRTEELPEIVTQSSRHRFEGRLNIDETKLEVLPLFEGETKIVSETGKKPNQFETLTTNPAENENSITSNTAKKTYKKTEIKESVVAQVTEVTSRRTVTRKPIGKPGKYTQLKNKLKSEISNGLTSSEEDISDSDNYPEHFKALIHSKKQVKESRPSSTPELSPIVKKTPETTRTSYTTPRTTIKYEENVENEVHPKTTVPTTLRPTRKRFQPSTKNPEIIKEKKNLITTRKFPTTTNPTTTKEQKFHSKFGTTNHKNEALTTKPIKTNRNYSRKIKENDKNQYNKNKTSGEFGNNRAQVTSQPIQKTSKYSSKYRGSSRNVARSSTPPPAYIPTIPSFRSYNPTEYTGANEEVFKRF